MSFTDDDKARAVAALVAHHGYAYTDEKVAEWVLAAVAPQIAARALREAARDWPDDERPVARWLRARAEGVES